MMKEINVRKVEMIQEAEIDSRKEIGIRDTMTEIGQEIGEVGPETEGVDLVIEEVGLESIGVGMDVITDIILPLDQVRIPGLMKGGLRRFHHKKTEIEMRFMMKYLRIRKEVGLQMLLAYLKWYLIATIQKRK